MCSSFSLPAKDSVAVAELNYMACGRSNNGLVTLPVELLYEIQLYALSDTLPYTSQRLYAVFQSVSLRFRAQYILARVAHLRKDVAEIYTRALRFRLCTQEVLEVIRPRLDDYPWHPSSTCELPRRLFKSLAHKSGQQWKDDDQPLPFLRYLYTTEGLPPIDTNSYEGYALTKAVHAQFLPLIHFLLDRKASPSCKRGLAVNVAIRQKDLKLVRLLLERGEERVVGKGGRIKRRKLGDRAKATPRMLHTAVKSDAVDIVEYLTQEKGVVPDMPTLKLMVMMD